MGPYRTAEDTPEQRRRALSALARAGFPQDVAETALRLSRAEAEALIIRFRDGLV
jgi:regulatory protein